MTPSEFLRRVAEEIRSHGWAQSRTGGVEDREGPCCLHVAFGRVLRSVLERGGWSAYDAAKDIAGWAWLALLATIGIGHSEVEGLLAVAWNDAPGRTVDEVLAALDHAASTVAVAA